MNVRLVCLGLTLCCACFAATGVRAQGQSPPKVESPAPDKSTPAAAPLQTVPLKNERGETVEVLRTPLLDELLRQLRSGQLKPQTDPAPWSIARIAIDGSSDTELATLNVILEIQVLADKTWVQVPLKLNEGTLQEQTYTGPGEAAPPTGTDPELGYVWALKGKGLHTLKFNMIVPLRKELPSRRLQLTLPACVVSDLKFRVPQPRIVARGDEGRARLTLKPTQDGATLIEMVGLGPRIDLTWQPQPDLGTVETILEARTAITATIDGRTMLLEANQRLGALQGNFQQVQVRLPRGSELLKIEGEYFQERVLDPQDATLVNVMLKNDTPVGIPIDLKWTVRVDIPSQSDRIVIEGFDVAKAKIQTGHLAIRLVGDFRLERIENQNSFVQRDNLSTLEKAVPPFPIRDDVSSAYSILRQPFQLAFHLQPEKPHFTVQPRLFLSLTADRMELTGEYDIQVFRGGIEDLTFDWPGWKEEGWKIDPVSPPNHVEETQLDNPSRVHVKLIERKVGSDSRGGNEPVAASSKLFTLTLHATRVYAADQPAQEFTLPGMLTANLSPADLVLVLADNLDADLRPIGDTANRWQSVPTSMTILPPKELLELRRRYYRLDAAHPRFSVAATVQKQQVATQTELDVNLDGSELSVQQRITYDVSYERLAQSLLLVPESLVGRATFSVSDEKDPTKFSPLVPIATGASEGTRKQQRLALVPPRIGKFEVLVQATVPVNWPMGAVSTLQDIPLVQSSDAEFSLTRVRLQKPRRERVTISGEGWTPQSPQNGASVWLATAKQSTVFLQCEKSDGTGQRGIAIPRRLVQAVFAPNGEVYCQARYLLSGTAAVLRVTFPPNTIPASVRWGTQRLDASSYGELAGSPSQYQITLPEIAADETDHLLTITYQLPRQSKMDSGDQRRLSAPEIISDGTPTQTFWQIQLPVNQHLWTLPAGFTPEFDWQRTGGWWVRMPRHTTEELDRWIGGDLGIASATTLTVSGNRYLFSSLEGSREMTFETLSAPLIVLIGASLALILGFILVNVPSTRHVLTLLWLGFLTTLAALWYSEPVLVLLQPAGLGLVLALLASVAQRWFKKSRVPPVLTVSTHSDLLTATSSREEMIPQMLVVASDPTTNHTPPYAVPEAGVTQ